MASEPRHFDRLLLRALELDPEERDPFLDQHCVDDPDLRRELEEALSDEDQIDTFLEQGALAALPRADLAEVLGSTSGPEREGLEVELGDGGTLARVGNYRIVRQIGRGGMGRVFLAEQDEPVSRQLAIKLIHTSLVGPRSLARFSAERQAMARLSHPNVARLYDAGTTEDGQPFFAMELVEGPSLLRYCDRREATLEQRLALFVDLCSAVHHAHLNQILHRDLKPSNILVTEVDGRPAVKVIDFGIAKALDTPLTEATLATGNLLPGTPAYMSPEALHRDESKPVDARTDVYSLGIVLYKLLAGDTPFDSKLHWADMVRRVSEADPPRPSRRFAALPEEKQTKIARRRGLEPTALGARLKGDLDWIVQKAIAKNPDQRYLSAAALADDIERHLQLEPVSAGPESLGYRFGKLVRRRRGTAAAAAVALLALVIGVFGLGYGLVRARHEAEEARRASLEAEAVADFLTELFTASDPYARRAGREQPEIPTALDLLEEGRLRIEDELHQHPVTRARILAVLGRVYKRLARYEEARVLLASSVEVLRQQGESPRLAAVLTEYGDLAFRERELDEAEALFREALEVLEPDFETHGLSIAKLHFELGSVAIRRNRFAEAEEHLGRAAAFHDPVDGSATAAARAMLAEIDDPGTAESRSSPDRDLAPVADRASAGAGSSEKSRTTERRRRQGNLASVLNAFGQLHQIQNRLDEAIEAWSLALDLVRDLDGETHPRVAVATDNLGVAYSMVGDLEKAEAHFRRALEIRLATLTPDDPDIALSYNNLGIHYGETDQLEKAEEMHRRALAIRETAFEADHPRVAWSLDNLGRVLIDLERLDEAEPLLLRGLAIREARLGSDHTEVARSLFALAKIDRARGDRKTAEQKLLRALEIRRARLGEDHPHTHSALRALAELRGEPAPEGAPAPELEPEAP